MGFFSELKSDLSQAVNTLMPESDPFDGKDEKASKPADLESMLDRLDEVKLDEAVREPEPEEEPEEAVSEPAVEEPAVEEPAVEEPVVNEPEVEEPVEASAPSFEEAKQGSWSRRLRCRQQPSSMLRNPRMLLRQSILPI